MQFFIFFGDYCAITKQFLCELFQFYLSYENKMSQTGKEKSGGVKGSDDLELQ